MCCLGTLPSALLLVLHRQCGVCRAPAATNTLDLTDPQVVQMQSLADLRPALSFGGHQWPPGASVLLGTLQISSIALWWHGDCWTCPCSHSWGRCYFLTGAGGWKTPPHAAGAAAPTSQSSCYTTSHLQKNYIGTWFGQPREIWKGFLLLWKKKGKTRKQHSVFVLQWALREPADTPTSGGAPPHTHPFPGIYAPASQCQANNSFELCLWASGLYFNLSCASISKMCPMVSEKAQEVIFGGGLGMLNNFSLGKNGNCFTLCHFGLWKGS